MDAALSEWFQPAIQEARQSVDEDNCVSVKVKSKRKRDSCHEEAALSVNDVNQMLNTYFQVNAPFNVTWFHGWSLLLFIFKASSNLSI
ncbi:unnamed protein product [Toxocara canis]|uniref:CTF/NF-I domain-containing protein n=1 Tax=Toxocara canis TaxID=6265 RepID=A0A183UV97_TOXCA|nr:unnamed protein product [Toxocara canis]